MTKFLTKLFVWISNHTEQDKLLHKDFGSLFFFLAYIAFFLCGVNNWLSLLFSLIFVALIGFLKEYVFDPIAIKDDEPDVKDALWTILGGIEIFIVIAIVYTMIK